MPCAGRTSIFGMLRAALRKFSSTSAPSIISALIRPSLSNCLARPLVLPSFNVILSMTMMPPSLALADNACLSASARTFLGNPMAWLRTTGPKERPPPRNRFTRAEPWRADPVPFCRYIFLPVRAMSARPLTAWVPARRLASCQVTQRCRISARASSPKMASGRSTEPAAVPSSIVTFNSMSRPLVRGGISRRGLRRFGGRRRASARQAELARHRRILRQRLLDRIAQPDPTALGAGHGALDQDEATLDVGHHHLEIERGHAIHAHVTRHLLFLERLARILATAGRSMGSMRDRHAVGGAQTAEVPTLHRTRKALADRCTGHVHILADDEMIGRDLGADRNELALLDAELRQLALGLHLGDREMAALGLVDVADLARAGAELERHVAVSVLGAVSDDLAIAQLQHSRGHVLARVGEDPHHSDLLCNHPGTHCRVPSPSLKA